MPTNSYKSSNIMDSLAKEISEVKNNAKFSKLDKILWKKGNLKFTDKEVTFGGETTLPENITCLETPFHL